MFRILVYRLPEDGKVMPTQVRVNEIVLLCKLYVHMFNLQGSNLSKLRWKIHKCHSNHKTVEGFLSKCKPCPPLSQSRLPCANEV